MLFERDESIEILIGAVHAAQAGHSSVVLLTGEAGIGKTSVVRAVLDQLPPGVRALTGACDDLLVPPALGPLRDAFRGRSGPVEQALASGDTEAVLTAVHAELGRPSVLVIEDLHWADDATVDLLRYLTRRLDRLRVVLVLTFRDGDLDRHHPVRSLLGTLTDPSVRRIVLEPLSEATVTAMSAGRPGLYQLTRGNPFYLTEVLAGPADAVPGSVVHAVLTRAHGLATDLLEQLSVLPSHLGLDLAGQLLDGRLDELAEAERRGVLRLHPDGIGFRHEIARRAIEQTLPAIRRRALHARVLETLLDTDTDTDPSRLVHHAVQADDADTVLRFAPLAARRATRAGSHRQALTQLEAVLPFLDRLATAERAQLLDDYAWELHIAHRFADAVRAGRAAIELRERSGDRVALAETLLRVSRHLYLAGDTAAARQTIDRANQIAEPSVLPAATAYRASLLALTGCPLTAVDDLTRAHDLAVAAGRTDLVALCLNYLGMTRADAGDPRGVRHLRASLDAALTTGDHESAARAYTNLAEVLYRQGHTEQLAEVLDTGLEFAAEHGFWSHRYNLEVHQALLSLRRGDWDDAERRLRRLLDTVDDPGMLYVYSVPVLGRLLARRGDLAAAEPMLATSWQRARRQQSLVGILYAGVGYAEWAWLSHRKDVAESIYQAASEHPVPVGLGHIMGELYRYLARSGVTVQPFDTCSEMYVAALRGDWQTASQHAVDPYERALELAESGAVEPTMAALRILDQLGATPAAAIVRRKLKALGVRRIPRGARSTTKQNPAGLTRRQLDVLALLADGLTNAEIAARLVLSVRTVDHHVSAILGKLGTSSRHEAARTATTLGLAS